MTCEDAYRQYGGLIYAICRKALGNPDDAQDVAQETWLAAWGAWARVQPDPAGPWLLALARTCCAAHWRRAYGRAAVRRSLPVVYDPTSDTRTAPETVEGALLAEELAHAIRRGWATLTPGQQYVLRGTLAAQDQASIGRALGKSEGAVKLLLHRARVQLRNGAQHS